MRTFESMLCANAKFIRCQAQYQRLKCKTIRYATYTHVCTDPPQWKPGELLAEVMFEKSRSWCPQEAEATSCAVAGPYICTNMLGGASNLVLPQHTFAIR
jgi:hypothetical protein